MIKFKNVSKIVDGIMVLDDVTITIPDGELTVLVGPSGCGKSTLLKMINRLIYPTSGEIFISDTPISSQDVYSLRQKIGYITPPTGLFNHLTVRENISISPYIENLLPEQREATIQEALKIVRLPDGPFLEKYPYMLTSLEKQRLGLARAFACDPQFFLLDDPLATLEYSERNDMQDEIIGLQARLSKSFVFTTSSIEEAIKIADNLFIMDNGKIMQSGKPEDILKNPEGEFVKKYIGRNVIFDNAVEITAADIMLMRPVVTHPDVPMLKSMEKMRLSRVDSLLVTDEENNFLGIVRAEHIHSCDNKYLAVQSIMREAKTTAHPTDSIITLIAKFREHNTNNIPVVADDKLVGLITKSTVVTTLSQQHINTEGVEFL